MSSTDRSISEELLDIAKQLQVLVGRVEELKQKVERLEVKEQSDWELVELASLAPGVSDPNRPYPFAARPAEEGPPELPHQFLQLARAKLLSKVLPAHTRAKRAFDSGFWARVSLDTCTPYEPLERIPALSPCHWIVLRGPGVAEPIRACTQREAWAAIHHFDSTVISEEFASLTELQLFCVGARIEIPALWRCRNLGSDSRARGSRSS